MWRTFLLMCIAGALHMPWMDACAATSGGDRTILRTTNLSGNAGAERRVALVIGSSDGRSDLPALTLRNPANDARSMGALLTSLGFEVSVLTDATPQQIRQALAAFRLHLADGGTGLFYFAGHGAQIDGETFLMPQAVDARSRTSLRSDGIDLASVLAAMSAPRAGKTNLVILDTCLQSANVSGDFSSHVLPHAESVSPASVPAQTLIAYATAPGGFAADGMAHGVYTRALLQALATDPQRDIDAIMQDAAKTVRVETRDQQRPWTVSSLAGAFRFAHAPGFAGDAGAALASTSVVAMRSRGIMPKDSNEQYELTFWDSIKNSNYASDYEAYLKAYPNGRFATLAKARIERLQSAASAPPAASKAPAPAQQPAQAAAPAPAATEHQHAASAMQATPAPAPAPAAAHVANATPAPSNATVPAPAATPAAAAVALKTLPPKATSATSATPPTAATASNAESKDCAACPAMISLPAGSFTMGSTAGDISERPPHRVTIGAPFAIGKYGVTVEQWNACVAASACPKLSNENATAANSPARDVSWDEAQQYVKWLNKVTGKPYRLPTEAEWEYAARGGTATPYWWGEQMRKGNANCKGCGDPWHEDGPENVGTFAANPYGLYDMGGNLWQWVSDCWHSSYKDAPADDRAWDASACDTRVIRGGSWREGADYMLASTRFKYSGSVRQSQNGFRVVKDLK